MQRETKNTVLIACTGPPQRSHLHTHSANILRNPGQIIQFDHPSSSKMHHTHLSNPGLTRTLHLHHVVGQGSFPYAASAKSNIPKNNVQKQTPEMKTWNTFNRSIIPSYKQDSTPDIYNHCKSILKTQNQDKWSMLKLICKSVIEISVTMNSWRTSSKALDNVVKMPHQCHWHNQNFITCPCRIDLPIHQLQAPLQPWFPWASFLLQASSEQLQQLQQLQLLLDAFATCPIPPVLENITKSSFSWMHTITSYTMIPSRIVHKLNSEYWNSKWSFWIW